MGGLVAFWRTFFNNGGDFYFCDRTHFDSNNASIKTIFVGNNDYDIIILKHTR